MSEILKLHQVVIDVYGQYKIIETNVSLICSMGSTRRPFLPYGFIYSKNQFPHFWYSSS